VKDGFVLFAHHRTETLHPAQIMDPIHSVLGLVSGLDLRHRGPDHRVAGDEIGESLLAPILCASRAHWQHHVADFGIAVPDAYFDVVRHIDTEFGQHLARFEDDSRTIWRRFVPVGRQAQGRPGVTGAESAHNNVVHLRRILQQARSQTLTTPLTMPQTIAAGPFRSETYEPSRRGHIHTKSRFCCSIGTRNFLIAAT
jgi:hypothetical protein